MSKKMNRRDFIKSTGAAAAAACLATGGMLLPKTAAASGDSVKLFLGATLSGAYASSGMYISRGMQLAIQNYGGSVLGRPIELIERDTPNPAEGVRKAQEAVERLGCNFITIAPSSSTILAVSEYTKKKGAVLFGHGGSDKITGSACNRSTFRWQVPTWGAIREVVPRVIKEYNAKTFYTITPKYVFGEDLLRNTQEVLDAKGLKLLGNSFHSLGESDFSSHITKAMASGADCVLFLNFGGDTVNALKQAHNFGLKQVSKIACAWGSGITQMKAIGPEILEGVIWGLQYFYKIDSPANKTFVSTFKTKYDEMPPYVSAQTYASTMTLLAAIEKAGTDDPSKVIATLEDLQYDGLTGKEVYRACDHQCIKPYFSVRCKAPSAMKTPEDFADIIGSSINFQECGLNGCSMG
ncbi:ABC transporter substrate-binding protein [Pseudodesulfovibrio cashew]|uniref:ABC transporter substrate-binding protein n=1 Tax=Pseudodesulfovibrio cashew TaxID=2678688 RepID=A0A6I6JLW6_9BACT|nr:ABC transporter substrate-binding protein [Pseudodesulfovibrio cashew]QGY41930.1 ABC transporter substrate-binding protein [Pseudodesulfovibrio cashew]